MKSIFTALLLFFTFQSFGQTKEDYQRISDSLAKTKSTDEIIAFFQEELKVSPKNEGLLRQIGFLYISKNQPDEGEKYYNEALAANPSCASCYANLARIYTLKKNPKRALELISWSISLEPANADFYMMRSRLREMTNDLTGALSDLNKAVELEPKKPDNYIERAIFNSTRSDYNTIIADFNKAVKLAPDSYVTYYKRAGFFFDQKMHNEALRDLNSAIRIDTARAELYTGRGAIYAFYNEHGKSLADYNHAIRLNPDEYISYYNRALDKYILEDMDGYCMDFQTSYDLLKKNNPEDPIGKELESSMGIFCDASKASYYYQRGIAFYNLNQFEKAVSIYTSGIEKFPENSMLLSFRGNAYLAKADYTHAIQDYNAALEHKENVIKEAELNIPGKSGSYAAGFVATMYISLAESRFGLEQYKEALEEINKGIALAPDLKDFGMENYYNVRGNIFLALGDYDQAIKDFDQCIQLNPAFALGYANRAIARINDVTKDNPRSLSVSINNSQMFQINWILSGKSHVRKTDAQANSALADINRAIAIDPNLALAYYVRGLLKKMLAQESYCDDLLKAGNSGFPVQAELLRNCRK